MKKGTSILVTAICELCKDKKNKREAEMMRENKTCSDVSAAEGNISYATN